MNLSVILNTESVRFPLTGIGRYTYELASALQMHTDIESLRFYHGGQLTDSLPEEQAQTLIATPNRSHWLKRWLQKSPAVVEAYRLISEHRRDKGLKKIKDSLYHGPNFFLPNFDGPRVATFHDLSPFTWAHCHEPAKVRYMQKALRKTLDCADRLITDSEFIRQELAKFSGWSLDKIDSVPLAAGPEFYPRAEVELQQLLNQYQLRYQGFTLFVSTIEPRKNIMGLLSAYAALPKNLRLQYPLVLAGYQGWCSDDIHQAIKDAEQEGWARYLGFLPAQVLPELFSAARLFAFPSHYEGFGLPILEAMQSGVPVVCSNSASLPEVAGDAALMCHALDIDQLTEHIVIGLQDDVWREVAITKGLAQAGMFSWQRCAEETCDLYKRLAGCFA